jgi:Zn-dependent protease
MRAWKIGRFFGIDLYIHWTFLLLPVLAIMGQNENDGANLPMLLGLFTVFGCIVLHEYGHALMARVFGIGTRDITLYVIGGVARLERISEKAWEELWIALAGPAVNVVIAMLTGLLMFVLMLLNPGLLMMPGNAAAPFTFLGFYLLVVLSGNIFLVLFNMAPAFPMDGGRVLRALLSMGLGQLTATRIAARVSVVVTIVGAGLLFYFTHSYMIFLVAFFVLMAGQQELRFVEWRHSREGSDEDAIPPIPDAAAFAPVQTIRPAASAHIFQPLNGLMFQPRVSVYVWDNQTGTWIKEGGPQPPPRLNEG